MKTAGFIFILLLTALLCVFTTEAQVEGVHVALGVESRELWGSEE